MTADIVTERLVLRALTMADAGAIDRADRHPLWADGYPTDGDREVAARLLASGLDGATDLGAWQVVDRASGLLVGGIGFYGGPDPDGAISVGYGIAAEFRNNGLTTEALGAMLRLAVTSARVRRVVAETTVDNAPSIRVLEKAGFVLLRVDGARMFYEYAVP